MRLTFAVQRGSTADRLIDRATGALYAAMCLVPESKPKAGTSSICGVCGQAISVCRLYHPEYVEDVCPGMLDHCPGD